MRSTRRPAIRMSSSGLPTIRSAPCAADQQVAAVVADQEVVPTAGEEDVIPGAGHGVATASRLLRPTPLRPPAYAERSDRTDVFPSGGTIPSVALDFRLAGFLGQVYCAVPRSRKMCGALRGPAPVRSHSSFTKIP